MDRMISETIVGLFMLAMVFFALFGRRKAPGGIVEDSTDESRETTRERAKRLRARVDYAARMVMAPETDPEALVMWRLAALWKMGETEARPRIVWLKVGGKTVYNVQIRRADGTIEDFSQRVKEKPFT